MSLKSTENKETVRADNQQMGEKYALALSQSMKHLQGTQVVDLPGNRLGKRGGAAILGSLAERVRNINLDHNHIGDRSMDRLVSWVNEQNQRCQLQDLSLQGNSLTDALVTSLCVSLSKSCPPLLTMNLSHNAISD